MRKPIMLAALLATAGGARAEVELFARGEALVPPSHPAVVADYAVQANIRGLAEELVTPNPAILFPRPDADPVKLRVHRWAPIRGFVFDESGRILLDPGAREDELEFTVYGIARGIELTLRVDQGRVSGSLTGMLAKRDQAWGFVDSKGQRVLREYDLSQVEIEPDLPSQAAPFGTPAVGATLPKHAVDGGGSIDVLVVRATNAIPLIGSEVALNELILQSVDDLNIALANSQANRVQINLLQPGGVVATPVAYDEAAVGGTTTQRWLAHRTWARQSAQVAQLRNQHQADLVLMMVGDIGTCGVAYTQRPRRRRCQFHLQRRCGL